MAATSHKLRSQNKPKCIYCGNIARSRCEYHSCKKCCAEAENPCAIHVLKANATIPVKTPTSAPTPFDQPPTEPSPFGSTRGKAYSYQLYNIFAQFNNLQSPLCSRRPPTRKESAVINEWRFGKLKEYKERITEVENEAFDRYMQNITLLEEVLCVNTKSQGSTYNVPLLSDSDPTSAEDSNKMVLSALRLKQRTNSIRGENHRKRVQAIVDQGLKKLQKIDLNDFQDESKKQNELATKDLLDRLSKARNEEDLKPCLQIKSDLFGGHLEKFLMQNEGVEVSNVEISENDIQLESDYSPPKWLSTSNADQVALVHIDSQFSSSEGIELL